MTAERASSARSGWWSRYLTRRCFSRSVRRDAWMLTHLGRAHDVTVKEWRRLP